jgi:hypothetical protein
MLVYKVGEVRTEEWKKKTAHATYITELNLNNWRLAYIEYTMQPKTCSAI